MEALAVLEYCCDSTQKITIVYFSLIVSLLTLISVLRTMSIDWLFFFFSGGHFRQTIESVARDVAEYSAKIYLQKLLQSLW